MFVICTHYDKEILFQHSSEEFCKELVERHNAKLEDVDSKVLFPKNKEREFVARSIYEKERIIASLKSLVKANVNPAVNQSSLAKMQNELKQLNKQREDLNVEYNKFKDDFRNKISENPDVNKVLEILKDCEDEIYYDVVETFDEYISENS